MQAHVFLGKLISKIKGYEYQIKYPFNWIELFIIAMSKTGAVCRGLLFVKPFLKHSKGLIFAEKGARVKFGGKVSCGKNFNMMQNSLLNALSYDGVAIGDNFTLGVNAIIECTGVYSNVGSSLSVGDNVGINHNCFIGVRGDIIIGSDVIFGPNVSVFSENHVFDSLDLPIKHQGVERKKTVIGSDIWIGANSTILAGVNIGSGSVIAAGAVVTKDVPKNSVVAGVPAKVIRTRN